MHVVWSLVDCGQQCGDGVLTCLVVSSVRWYIDCCHQQRPDRPAVERPLDVPSVELACNPSSFAVYCGVRRAVLVNLMHQLSATLRHTVADTDSDADNDEDAAVSAASDSALPRLPKVTSLTPAACALLTYVVAALFHPALVCLSVCLCISRITQETVGEFRWMFLVGAACD